MTQAVVREVSGGVLLRVRVIPRSKRTVLAGMRGDSLVIKLTAPPVDGAANSALVSFLAKILDVPASAVTIVTGAGAREKTVHVKGTGMSAAIERLGLSEG